MKLLEGKVAIITGASRGIGKSIAETFIAHGATVAFTYLSSDEKAKALEAELTANGGTARGFKSNASEFDAAQKLADDVLEAFGQIDILVNNAGNAHGLSDLASGDVADWDAMLGSNVSGLLYVTKAVIPGMIERGGGHIVNLSSVAGKITYANGTVYCATKKAVEAISEGIRLDHTKDGIKVTNIAPGAVETEFSEVRFKGDKEKAKKVYEGFDALLAEDIADAIAYAVSVPDRVAISDMTIYAKAQASPTTVYRK